MKFCFIKATDGAHGKDKNFTANWDGAQSDGLIRGAYHFFRPHSSVEDHVSSFVTKVGALDSSDLPPVLDLEIPSDDVTAWSDIEMPQAVNLALDWLTGVQTQLKRTPIVYTNRQFVNEVLGGDASALKGFPLWLAHFTKADDPTLPGDWDTWQFWQYSDRGKLSGIDSNLNVDLNRFNGSLEELQKFVANSVILDA